MTPNEKVIFFASIGLFFLFLDAGVGLIIGRCYLSGCLWGIGVGLSIPNWANCLGKLFGPKKEE